MLTVCQNYKASIKIHQQFSKLDLLHKHKQFSKLDLLHMHKQFSKLDLLHKHKQNVSQQMKYASHFCRETTVENFYFYLIQNAILLRELLL